MQVASVELGEEITYGMKQRLIVHAAQKSILIEERAVYVIRIYFGLEMRGLEPLF